MSGEHPALSQAFQWIEAGRPEEAIALLRPLLDNELRDDAEAWWVYAHAVSDTDDARRALETALRLDPNMTDAADLLRRINELPGKRATATVGRITTPAAVPGDIPEPPPMMPERPERLERAERIRQFEEQRARTPAPAPRRQASILPWVLLAIIAIGIILALLALSGALNPAPAPTPTQVVSAPTDLPAIIVVPTDLAAATDDLDETSLAPLGDSTTDTAAVTPPATLIGGTDAAPTGVILAGTDAAPMVGGTPDALLSGTELVATINVTADAQSDATVEGTSSAATAIVTDEAANPDATVESVEITPLAVIGADDATTVAEAAQAFTTDGTAIVEPTPLDITPGASETPFGGAPPVESTLPSAAETSEAISTPLAFDTATSEADSTDAAPENVDTAGFAALGESISGEFTLSAMGITLEETALGATAVAHVCTAPGRELRTRAPQALNAVARGSQVLSDTVDAIAVRAVNCEAGDAPLLTLLADARIAQAFADGVINEEVFAASWQSQ